MVSTASQAGKNSPIVKVEDTKVDIKPTETAATPITGRQLLTRYLNNCIDADVTYKKLCNAIGMFEGLTVAASRTGFIEQLVNTSDLLDNRCSVLVNNLAHVSWQYIPEDVAEKFHKLLGEIAVRHVCHTEVIYQSAVRHLIPIRKKWEEIADGESHCNDGEMETIENYIDEEVQKRIFTSSHQLIAHILKCFPMSSKILMSNLRYSFPHVSQSSKVFNGYIRNLIQIGEYSPSLFSDIWDLIIENAVVVDSYLSRKEGELGATIFQLDVSEGEKEVVDSEAYQKLDIFSADIFSYLSLKHGFSVNLESAVNTILTNRQIEGSDIFRCFLNILENRLLLSVNVRYTSFVWLYLCSLDERYIDMLLEFLWSIIIRPQCSQTDTKKAHGAANYLAAFVARSKAVRLGEAVKWMKRIFDWCVNYIDNISSVQAYAGGIRHGLFYAHCQALFIIFSFRYKDMDKSGDMEDIRRWGIGRLVHCPLDPLRYINRPVGLCFGTISRSLQLVYVNHILQGEIVENKPFESAFPLDFYNLASTERLISPLIRRFSPLAEDLNTLTAVLRSSTDKEEDSGMDFLDDEELMTEMPGSKPISINQQNSMFTVFSTSPGLCHFDSSMR